LAVTGTVPEFTPPDVFFISYGLSFLNLSSMHTEDRLTSDKSSIIAPAGTPHSQHSGYIYGELSRELSSLDIFFR
jgi:hypothetical protein